MKRQIKQIIAYSLAAVSLVSLAGCGSSDTQTGDGTQTHFSVFVKDTSNPPSDDNKILKKIEDELGYTFDFEYLVGNIDEKMGVMIAGGDYDDLVACSDTKLIEAGALVPMDEYISEEETPNLYTHISTIKKKITYDDGHIYILPNYNRLYGEDNETTYQGPAFWIQKAVLEDAGYPEIKTLDQYFELIESYKEKNPQINGMDTIGFEALTTTGYEWVLTTAPNYLAGNPNNGGVIVDNDTYEAHIYATDDISKKYYEKLNEEYSKGIIDPETFTQNKDQYLSKISSGRVLGMFDQHWVFGSAENSLKQQNLIERQYVPLPITYDESIEPWYRDQAVLNVNQGYGISVNCKDPKAAVKMLDTFLSEEWQKIFQWGIEGEDYLVNDEGRIYRTPEMREEQSDPVWKTKNKIEAFYSDLPKIQGTFSDGNGTTTSKQVEEFQASLSDYDKNFLDSYGKKSWMEFLNPEKENPVYYPAWDIDLVDASAADYANQKLTDAAVKHLPKVIMSGGDFESEWKSYVDEIAGIDVKSYEDRINEVIKWRVENWTEE
ncbi:MAG: extracellular solute-binding protein [Candidatus Ornithomonoglobus sp.]